MVAMMRDKKFKEGNMVFIVPIDIGRVEINKAVSADRVRAIVEQLKEEA
jgi:3-dehydroquinate synthase